MCGLRIMILITGAGGQLGRSLTDLLAKGSGDKFIAADRIALDIADKNATRKYVEQLNPQVIIHTASMTDVDLCEAEPNLAYQVNADGAFNVADAATAVGAKMVFVSTDYVFDGTQHSPYLEDDLPNPVNIYGMSKLKGELLAQEVCSELFILRTAWLYSEYGRNFVSAMVKLAEDQQKISVVNDQFGSPTWAEDLARQILLLLETSAYGIYHAVSHGSCSRYEFASEIFNVMQHEIEVKPVGSEEFPRPARRPAHCVLENGKLQHANLDIMPHWKVSLAEFLTEPIRETVR